MPCVQAINRTRRSYWALLAALGAGAACSTSPPESGSSSTPGGGSDGAGSSQAGSLAAPGGGAIAGGGGASSSSGNAGAASAGKSANGGKPSDQGSAGGDSAGAGSGGSSGGENGAAGAQDGGAYDTAVLSDDPVGYWAIDLAPANERDLSGNGHDGSYQGQGTPIKVSLPNGDSALAFDGETQYLSIPSSPGFSIPTTGNLTWEAWIRPDVLQFPNDDGVSGYVDWLGKCEEYGPTCEWEARMYNTNTNQTPNRPNRLSAYVFNPSAGLGSGADWQPSPGVIEAGSWYHVVGEYTTLDQPDDCRNTEDAPGSIEIWVNAVKWDHDSHGQTGCMSQYDVEPKANDSAVNVATMAKESFFKGAIGKLAIYDHLLSQARIEHHYTLMTGKQPKGSCGDTCSLD